MIKRRRRFPGSYVKYPLAIFVHGISRGHKRRPNRGGAPLRVGPLEQRREPAHVRARHRRAGDDVESHAPAINRQTGGTQCSPTRYDVDTWRDNVRLENLRRDRVGTPGAESGHHRGRLDPHLGPLEENRDRRFRIRGQVLLDLLAGLLTHRSGRQEVSVGDELLAVRGGVSQYHP
ncbi:LOW QUALITY PROTEIN: hypothetical protein TorRG33x02_033910 [Trema orientale]|uniref:Uncharacterized protein n=1 Tax=Trema orientale TaxID=63057 RepID=A0A2P5FSK6_TREOI|nr:LOW QUALITY PROTEIN: hypothetical protein TorRG33x02_033910 [Trema orientale]